MSEKRRLAPYFFASALLVSNCIWAIGQPDELAAKSQRGREAMSAGKYKEAISIYQELVKALPAEPGLRLNLGMAHYMAGHYRDSIRHLEAAVKANPELTQAYLFLGASEQRLGNPTRAVPSLQKYVGKDGKDPRGRQLLGDALFAVERFEQAAEQYDALTKLEAENPKAWHGLGRSYEALAGRAFESLEKIAPESAYLLALVADTRAVQQQYRSAFFFYRRALEKQPKIRGIHMALSQIYRRTGHAEWATQEEEKEMRLGLPDCNSEKVVCDFLAGRFREALDAVKNKQTPEAYYWRSQIYNALALDALSRLAKLPPSFEMHEVMAEIHRNQGRHVESVKEWKKALEISPGNPIARKELAVSLILTHDYDAAKPLVDSLLTEEPDSAQVNYLAGDILLNQQRPGDAVPFLKKALEFDPDFPPAHSSLGRAYLTIGEAAKAIPHLKSALVLDTDGSLLYQLAQAYRSTGQRELAGQMLQKYQEIQKTIQAEREQLEKEAKITPP
jgi:predicted Zn-dependent protease